jgi:hypothetical protein
MKKVVKTYKGGGAGRLQVPLLENMWASKEIVAAL